MRTEARIPDELANKAKSLVGYHGHKSFNDVLVKALLEYVAKHEKKSK